MSRSYLPAGTAISRYALIRPIGSGGSATVYEAADQSLGRRVAVKVLPMTGQDPPERRAATRFLREARAAARISHPHVVSIFDFGIDGELAFLVMELVEGETLAGLLKREGSLGMTRTLDVLLPIVAATAELHTQGIIHRDIKPANILLRSGEGLLPKLTDFGLSQFIEETSTLTESGRTVGTPEYMAPEMTRDSHEASERSDVYALGVTLYECATGTRPFRGPTTYEVMRAAVRGRAAPPSALEPGLSKEFDRIVLRAIHRKAEERFESVDQLGVELLPLALEVTADRWRRDLRLPSSSSSVPHLRQKEGAPQVAVNDGVAISMRGDAIVVLWKASARMDRVEWMFDITDRFAERLNDGLLALVITLPSSGPPDYGTILQCIKRVRVLAPRIRRQATVALGGNVWRSIVLGVHRAVYRPTRSLARWITVSTTLGDGIGKLLEHTGPLTPTRREFWGDVLGLGEELDVNLPEARVQLSG